MGTITHLQFAPQKNKPVVRAETLTLLAGRGIEGDHHAKEGSQRQVLVMAEKNCIAFGLAPGAVRENIVTRGLDVQALAPGMRLEAGGAVLEITKDCAPCPFIDTLRPGLQDQIKGRRGMLARVITSGRMTVGDEVRVVPAG